MTLFDDIEGVTTSPLPPSKGGQAPRLGIAERIERVRAFFELADNWPVEPFWLNQWSWVADPAEFVDGHLTFLLSVENDALKVPYLERLEGLILSRAVTPPEAKGTPPPPKAESG